MQESLSFVKGAVGKKDLVSPLTHFRIHEGRITGYNGKMSLSAPIALDINCCPKAEQMVKAIEACGEVVRIVMTASGKLSIRSGKFKALVDTVALELFPFVEPDGVDIDGAGLINALKTVAPFMGQDASRPWACGVLLDGFSAYATNNVIFAECWVGKHFPYRVNIPHFAVKELLRLGEDPIRIQLNAHSATFHFEGDRWMMTQLINTEWPNTDGLFAKIKALGEVQPVAPDLWEALDLLKPFVDEFGHVYCQGDRLSTSDSPDVEKAGVDLDQPAPLGIYNHENFALLAPIATHIDLAAHPAPMTWYGANVRGLFIGMRA